jgi:ABC-type glutathione transport system ATPase component
MVVLHDLTFAARWADKIITMKNGALHVHLLDMAIRGVVTSAKKLLHGNGWTTLRRSSNVRASQSLSAQCSSNRRASYLSPGSLSGDAAFAM